MAKPLSYEAGVQRHSGITDRPVSTRDWQQHFQPNPLDSLESLLIKTGPFDASRDAFRFRNEFTFTDVQLEQVRQRYQAAIDGVVGASPLQSVKDVLHSLSVDIFGKTIGLPDLVVDAVTGDVQSALLSLLTDLIVNMTSPQFGRCGGMAFSGYDFYRLDWRVDQLGALPPNTGVLGDYIFNRLLDSLDLNVGTFLEWFTNLHLMPTVSTIANTSLGIAIGSVGGLAGEAFGALLGHEIHLFNLGGPKSLLDSTKDEWPRIKNKLDQEAAWPVGWLFGDSDAPWDDHQVLALSYDDHGDGTAMLRVWDNREGNTHRDLQLVFTGDELQVANDIDNGHLKGIFLEEYSPQQPPDSLHLP